MVLRYDWFLLQVTSFHVFLIQLLEVVADSAGRRMDGVWGSASDCLDFVWMERWWCMQMIHGFGLFVETVNDKQS